MSTFYIAGIGIFDVFVPVILTLSSCPDNLHIRTRPVFHGTRFFLHHITWRKQKQASRASILREIILKYTTTTHSIAYVIIVLQFPMLYGDLLCSHRILLD